MGRRQVAFFDFNMLNLCKLCCNTGKPAQPFQANPDHLDRIRILEGTIWCAPVRWLDRILST